MAGHIAASNLLQKLVSFLQNDWAESLTATGRKDVNTLTDACHGLWWLFSRLGFHWTPPVLPSMKTPRRQKDKKKLAKPLCNSLPRRKGRHVFVRVEWLSQSQCPGSVHDCLFGCRFNVCGDENARLPVLTKNSALQMDPAEKKGQTLLYLIVSF